MIRRLLSSVGVVLVAGVPAFAQARCTPTTDQHERWTMKTRPAASDNPEPVTVAKMIAWSVPDGLPARQDSTLDAREDQVFVLTAYVRLAKLSPDDCDYHMELSDSADGTSRVIAEIPQKCPDVQAALRQALGVDVTSTKQEWGGKDAKLVTLIGYGFLDLSHKINKGTVAQKKKGHNHGSAAVKTLWEIHPVYQLMPGR